jgi:pyridoxine/pyridoxamine 5'-phosphate oxidase
VTHVDLFHFIAKSKLGVLSSIGPLGKPQSALVGFAATEKLEIIFDTVKSSRKYGNLIARPECAFVFGWSGEQTVQYEGIAEELAGEALCQYQEIYFRVWPDGPARLSWPGIVHFVVRPKWVRYSDFDQSPRLVREFTF